MIYVPLGQALGVGAVAAGVKFMQILEEKENWSQISPKKGDHIRVDRGLYTHHGVFFSEDVVIHFNGQENDNIMDWAKNEILSSNLQDFLRGGVLEVRGYSEEEKEALLPPNQIYANAKSCLGKGNYNLFFNNCEHFANACTLGKHQSKQIERLVTGRLPVDKTQELLKFFAEDGLLIPDFFLGGSDSMIYVPDKEKVAEIHQQTQGFMENQEEERITFLANAQIELLTFLTNSQVAIFRAEAQDLDEVIDFIHQMEENILEVEKKRLELLVLGSLELVLEMEMEYHSLILENNIMDNWEKLTKLLELSRNTLKGTGKSTRYLMEIEKKMSLQQEYYLAQLVNVADKQNQHYDSLMCGKESVLMPRSEIPENILRDIKAEAVILARKYFREYVE